MDEATAKETLDDDDVTGKAIDDETEEASLCDEAQELPESLLGAVYGGMRWEQFRQSRNVEDRRPGRRHNVVPRPRRGPDLSRSSLARDAGINDIGRRRR
jgi:hypothetical protein